MKVRAILKSKYFASNRHIANHIKYLARQSPLFDEHGREIDTDAAVRTSTAEKKSTSWRLIYSLNEDDAERLNIDRDYMKQLIAAKSVEIGKAYNITPANLHIVASWHNKDYHPHLHMIVWSIDPHEGYIPVRKDIGQDKTLNRATEAAKSCLTNEIFSNDLAGIKEAKYHQREQMNEQLKRIVQPEYSVDKELQDALIELGRTLRNTPGKHVYKLLPSEVKGQVDAVLEKAIMSDPIVKQYFSAYERSQYALARTYAADEEALDKKYADWYEGFFHPYAHPVKSPDVVRHNIIIRAADAMSAPIPRKPKISEPNALTQNTTDSVYTSYQVAVRLAAGTDTEQNTAMAKSLLQSIVDGKIDDEQLNKWAQYRMDCIDRAENYHAKNPVYSVQHMLYLLARNIAKQNQQQQGNNDPIGHAALAGRGLRKRKNLQPSTPLAEEVRSY